MKPKYFFLLAVFLAIPLIAKAQSTFGSIVGVAQDTDLATVAGATITIKNLDENTTRSTTSDSEGGFQFLNLKPGSYEITATKYGLTDFMLAVAPLESRPTLRV